MHYVHIFKFHNNLHSSHLIQFLSVPFIPFLIYQLQPKLMINSLSCETYKKSYESDLTQFQFDISSTSGVIDWGIDDYKTLALSIINNVITPAHQDSLSSTID